MNEDRLKRSIARLEAEVAEKDAEIDAKDDEIGRLVETVGSTRSHYDTLVNGYIEKIGKLESWLALADNALLDLEEGWNGEDAMGKLMRVAAERIEGGWSPFDYPLQVKALKEEVAKLRDAPEPDRYQWVRSIIESHAPENHGPVREGECRCRWCLVWDAVGEKA